MSKNKKRREKDINHKVNNMNRVKRRRKEIVVKERIKENIVDHIRRV